MSIVAWPRDTIASRFAWTVVLAVAAALALVRLFFVFGGVWAHEPLDHSILRMRAAHLFRVIEAAPTQMRPILAAAAVTKEVAVDWYDTASPVSAMLWRDSGLLQSKPLQRGLLGDLRRTAVVFEPHSAIRPPLALMRDQPGYLSAYFLCIQLSDRGWLVFSVPNRTWGLPELQRWAVWLTFATLSTLAVCAIATRRFAPPLELRA
jgi:two-component system osmolarity sensor histidine kinase EnvZ